jgi:hypothetical protein
MTALAVILARLWDSSVVRSLALFFVAVALFWGFYRLGRSLGEKQARAEDAIAYQAAMAKADAKYREQERANAKQVSDLRVEYAKTESSNAASDAGAVRDFAAGVRRVRIPIAACRPSAAQAGAATARVDGPQDAELAGQTASDLEGVTADGDTAIRQLGALQAWARSAVALCNGGKRE